MKNPEVLVESVPLRPHPDTSRSWRAFHKFIVAAAALMAACLGGWMAYTMALEGGNTSAQVGYFEESLRRYARALAASSSDVPSQAYPNGELGAAEGAMLGRMALLSYRNQAIARDRVQVALAESAGKASSIRPTPWVVSSYTKALMHVTWVSVVSLLAGGLVGILVSHSGRLLWWFIIDRLRELSRALRGI